MSDLPQPSLFDPTRRLDHARRKLNDHALENARRGVTVMADLAGGGKVAVKARSGKPADIEEAFKKKQKEDPTLRDSRLQIKNDDPDAVFEGAGTQITGIAPKSIHDPRGVTLAKIAGHMAPANKDFTHTTMRDATLSMDAGNSSLTPKASGVTLQSLAGANNKVGRHLTLGLVNAPGTKPDHPSPNGSIRPGDSDRLREIHWAFPVPRMAA